MRRWLEGIAAGWALLGGAVLIVIVLVTVANAAAFTLDRVVQPFGGTVGGLPGYEDFVRLAISSAGLMLFPYCQVRRGHISIDVFTASLPRRLQDALARLAVAGIAALAVFLAWWMLLGLLETRADGALSRVLGWPEWPFFLPGVASLVLWAAVAAAQLVEPGRG